MPIFRTKRTTILKDGSDEESPSDMVAEPLSIPSSPLDDLRIGEAQMSVRGVVTSTATPGSNEAVPTRTKTKDPESSLEHEGNIQESSTSESILDAQTTRSLDEFDELALERGLPGTATSLATNAENASKEGGTATKRRWPASSRPVGMDSDLEKKIWEACWFSKEDDHAFIKSVVQSNPRWDFSTLTNDYGETILHYAAQKTSRTDMRKNILLLKFLLSVECFQKIAQYGFTYDKQRLPLHYAAECHNKNAVAELLKHMPDIAKVNALDWHGATPLARALESAPIYIDKSSDWEMIDLLRARWSVEYPIATGEVLESIMTSVNRIMDGRSYRKKNREMLQRFFKMGAKQGSLFWRAQGRADHSLLHLAILGLRQKDVKMLLTTMSESATHDDQLWLLQNRNYSGFTALSLALLQRGWVEADRITRVVPWLQLIAWLSGRSSLYRSPLAINITGRALLWQDILRASDTPYGSLYFLAKARCSATIADSIYKYNKAAGLETFESTPEFCGLSTQEWETYMHGTLVPRKESLTDKDEVHYQALPPQRRAQIINNGKEILKKICASERLDTSLICDLYTLAYILFALMEPHVCRYILSSDFPESDDCFYAKHGINLYSIATGIKEDRRWWNYHRYDGRGNCLGCSDGEWTEKTSNLVPDFGVDLDVSGVSYVCTACPFVEFCASCAHAIFTFEKPRRKYQEGCPGPRRHRWVPIVMRRYESVLHGKIIDVETKLPAKEYLIKLDEASWV